MIRHLDWLKKTENQRREPRVFGSYLKHSSGGVSCFEDLKFDAVVSVVRRKQEVTIRSTS